MTNKISKKLYSISLTTAFLGMAMISTQSLATQNAIPPPQEPVAVVIQAEASPPVPGSFEALDVNADANLAKEEIPADHPLSKKYKKADTDKNGQLSKEEFETYQAKNSK